MYILHSPQARLAHGVEYRERESQRRTTEKSLETSHSRHNSRLLVSCSLCRTTVRRPAYSCRDTLLIMWGQIAAIPQRLTPGPVILARSFITFLVLYVPNRMRQPVQLLPLAKTHAIRANGVWHLRRWTGREITLVQPYVFGFNTVCASGMRMKTVVRSCDWKHIEHRAKKRSRSPFLETAICFL